MRDQLRDAASSRSIESAKPMLIKGVRLDMRPEHRVRPESN
jgi:hypothetical protein